MKPIRVTLFHRDNWYRHARIDGQFAYEVPEFVWKHHPVPKAFRVDLRELDWPTDIAWLDEGKYAGNTLFVPARGKRPVPVVCHFMYTTLAPHIRNSRARRARLNADLVLLDYDDPERFADVGLPVGRCAYSVNERLYRDRGFERAVDVGFYCVWRWAPERWALHAWLDDFCQRKGYVYNACNRVVREYPEFLARAKVVVHLNRTPTTRPARIFDVAASRTAFLSNPMPEVSGERWEPWKHYVPFASPTGQHTEKKDAPVPTYADRDCVEVIKGLEWLLDEGHWEEIAGQAHEYVLANHTWATRARQLRRIFVETFPKLKE